jgi:hypothetical protein
VSFFCAWDCGAYDLSVPIVYGGDALYEIVVVKALTEGAWNYNIRRLGAPFWHGRSRFSYRLHAGLLFHKAPVTGGAQSMFINQSVLAAYFQLGRSIRHVPLQVLAYKFGVGRNVRVLYAIIPFVFYRNIMHLNLVHFMVPGAAYLDLLIATRREFLALST